MHGFDDRSRAAAATDINKALTAWRRFARAQQRQSTAFHNSGKAPRDLMLQSGHKKRKIQNKQKTEKEIEEQSKGAEPEMRVL